jgi:DNA-binding CsgD family transcriptional regulator
MQPWRDDMKRTSAIAHFRQLCCLGLGAEAVIPSLLSVMHELIPSETNGFFLADETGHLAGFVPEYVIPEVIGTLLDNFEGLVERALPLNFAATMLRGRPVGNLLPAFDQDFYRGDLYHLIYRPYNLHHAIDGVVRDAPDGRGMGAFVVGRSAQQPQFSAAEKDTLNRLLPYLAHAMHRGDESKTSAFDSEFADSGESGLLILDQRAQVAYISARARQILYFATHPGAATDRERGKADARIAPPLLSVFTNLIRISQEHDAAPPVAQHRNPWGRFVFRAHWLEPGAGSTGALVGVTVQQQQPLALVLMHNMRAAGLSEKQRQVCLLLAQAQSFDSIATQLCIGHATAKDYADRIYRKLDVHTREELLQKLRRGVHPVS